MNWQKAGIYISFGWQNNKKYVVFCLFFLCPVRLHFHGAQAHRQLSIHAGQHRRHATTLFSVRHIVKKKEKTGFVHREATFPPTTKKKAFSLREKKEGRESNLNPRERFHVRVSLNHAPHAGPVPFWIGFIALSSDFNIKINKNFVGKCVQRAHTLTHTHLTYRLCSLYPKFKPHPEPDVWWLNYSTTPWSQYFNIHNY